MIHKIAKIYKAMKRLEKKLPHLKIIPENLHTIQQKGINCWLQEQKQTWECPDCKTNYSWYQRECSQCGKDLESLKDYNKFTI
jgi:hypothetical protein